MKDDKDPLFDDFGDDPNEPDVSPELRKEKIKEEKALFDQVAKTEREFIDPLDLTHVGMTILSREINKLRLRAFEDEAPLTPSEAKQLADYIKTTIVVAKEYRDGGVSEDEFRSIDPDELLRRVKEVARNMHKLRGTTSVEDDSEDN